MSSIATQSASSGVSSTSNSYTLTYSGASSRILPESTSNPISTALSVNLGVLFAYASASQAESIPITVNALRADLEETKKVFKQLILDLKGSGIIK